MNPENFVDLSAGRVIRAPGGYLAFVPAPLPPKLEFTPTLLTALSRADAALGELSGAGRHLPNPHLLITPYLRREAVLSSRIEGTRTTLDELLLDEAKASVSQRDPEDLREVRNYVTALEYGLARLDSLPLSLRLVRELHGRLMTGVRGDLATPGEFRRSQNWIGPPGSTPDSAPYVPPPPGEMTDALRDWESFLHVRGELPDLIQCALIHEQFEAIHPFLDGNGRVGRLLITLFLVERGRLSQPLLYLSEFIEARRVEYYERLQSVRTHGAWGEWITYFLEGVRVTAERALTQTRDLLLLRERMRSDMARSAKALRVVDELFHNPYVNTARVREILGVTDPTARKLISFLEKAGHLREVTGREWGRLHRCDAIFNALEPASAT